MKKNITFLFILVFFLFASQIVAQKKLLTHDDIESWNRITETVISDDGEWIAYKIEPWRGDSRVFLYNKDGKINYQSDCSTGIKITDDSEYMIFVLEPEYEKVRQLKIEKTKKEDMPGNKVLIYDIKSGIADTIERYENYKVPDEWAPYIAYQLEPAEDKEIEKKESPEDGDAKEKAKKESDKNGFILYLRNIETGDIKSWPFVNDYHFAEESRRLVFVSTGDENDFDAGIYVYDIDDEELRKVISGDYEYKQITIRDKGNKLAFLAKAKEDTDSYYSLYTWAGDAAREIVRSDNPAFPSNWKISENGRLRFSADGNKLFFGTAPVRPERDSTILDDEYPDVDVWHGSEGELHTVQVINRERDLRRTYLAVCNLDDNGVLQIETEAIPDSRLIRDGDSDHVLLLSNKPYELQSMWEGSPQHYDVYLMNLSNGEREMIKKDIRANVQTSPGGKYIVWFNYPDYSYYSYSIEKGREFRITDPGTIRAENELNDVPNYAYPYGSPGWLKDDEAVMIYDRYDIWKVDPEAGNEPLNFTVSGRTDRITYRLINFDPEEDFLNEKEIQYLTGINEVSRESGYYSWNMKKASPPELLIGGEYRLSSLSKAKEAETTVFTMETFNIFPDLHVSDLKFRKSTRISDANPQQDEFLWGQAELYTWTSLDGRKLEGLLYKPGNFDPSKKYPMIVNFYEKSSGGLYSHRIPELHRSTIDYHYYTGNGYVVFNPDVYYEDGYPGESAYNCVMPGVTALIDEGFIDPDRIGAQGHSWGGYQVAYLATRTDLFAAIESGAPVVNMFSAYGGIRWWTGLNRSFQYEHTQSRIGGSIWEQPMRYFENSPLFTMDKVTTPILIMHNDQDGHVPWYQGIEYFIALRRLQKPVWMLNYTGEPHWPQKLKNKKDFQIRLAQFFAHYLKEEPMPRWMKEGVPAVEKEYELGYDPVKQ